MKMPFIIIGVILIPLSIVMPVAYYIINILAGGLLSIVTCCLGDLLCWAVSGLCFIMGIVFIILGIVMKDKPKQGAAPGSRPMPPPPPPR